MSSFFDELKRRNVIKAAIAYAVIAWVVLQVLSIILPNIQAPEWVMKTFTVLAIIGFPVWVLISWVYEVTPEGLKKTSEVEDDRSITATTNKRLNILILVGLVLAIAVSFINRPSSSISERDLSSFDNSIAVLPFDDMSSEGDTQWFCDGMTEDILTNLSRIKELKVISRTSTERYRETDKSIPEIAAELGVSYVVEGSVRKFEDQVIITAQLIDANDTHLWAQNYDDNFKEVFKIQQDVSQKIVNQLKIAISPAEEKAITKLPTENLEAYNLVLKGRSFYEKGSIENLVIGADLLEEATQLDDQYAEAFAELAYVNLLIMYYREAIQTTEYLEVAKRTNAIALRLDPNSVRANSTEGLIMTESEDKETRRAAETFFKKALNINPNDAVSHMEIAIFYNDELDDHEKALVHAKQAYDLNPLAADVVWTLANTLIELDQTTKARALFEERKSILPDDMEALLSATLNGREADELLKSNDWKGALKKYTDGIKREPNNYFMHGNLGGFYDNYLNDDLNSIKHFGIAKDLDSTKGFRYRQYHVLLCEAGQFDKAQELMESVNYKKYTSPFQKVLGKYYFNYHQEKYGETRQLLSDSLIADNVHMQLLTYAQLGNKDKVHDILKNKLTTINDKAFAFAILQERDSLYHYLNNEKINAAWMNSRREFDLYRKEPQYIAFMKKNHLPLLEKYNGVTE